MGYVTVIAHIIGTCMQSISLLKHQVRKFTTLGPDIKNIYKGHLEIQYEYDMCCIE